MHVGREGQSSEQTQYNTGVEEAFFTKSLGCRRSSRRRLLSPIHALHRAHERTARPRSRTAGAIVVSVATRPAGRPLDAVFFSSGSRGGGKTLGGTKACREAAPSRVVVDFDQLRTFLEIVRLKSFSKAAQTCFRTQPAISAQIRQMEQELGTQLFERFGSRISLTTAGKTFAEYARQLLDLKRQGFDAVRELDRIPKGEVSIAAHEATCVNVLPQVFATFRERFSEVQVQVIRSYSSKTIQAVMDNSVDFGITQLPVREKRIEVVQIHPMRFGCWCLRTTRSPEPPR